MNECPMVEWWSICGPFGPCSSKRVLFWRAYMVTITDCDSYRHHHWVQYLKRISNYGFYHLLGDSDEWAIAADLTLYLNLVAECNHTHTYTHPMYLFNFQFSLYSFSKKSVQTSYNWWWMCSIGRLGLLLLLFFLVNKTDGSHRSPPTGMMMCIIGHNAWINSTRSVRNNKSAIIDSCIIVHQFWNTKSLLWNWTMSISFYVLVEKFFIF